MLLTTTRKGGSFQETGLSDGTIHLGWIWWNGVIMIRTVAFSSCTKASHGQGLLWSFSSTERQAGAWSPSGLTDAGEDLRMAEVGLA